MTAATITVLCLLIFAVAVAYSSVGQAGATGYLAVMALAGIAPEVMKPTALLLNLLVAAISAWQLQAAGIVKWRSFAPLLFASVPAAFIGGAVQLPELWFRYLVGSVLVLAALIGFSAAAGGHSGSEPSRDAALPSGTTIFLGVVVGLLSGLTGTGGGVFLAPLVIALGWASARSAGAITAPFNLVNSLAALTGNIVMLRAVPYELGYFAGAALIGAIVGTQLALRWLSLRALQFVMSVVLLAAGAKFLFT